MILQIRNAGRVLARSAAFGFAVWAASGPALAQAGDPAKVTIENFSFVPDAVTVKVGATVVWENGDDIPHSIVLADKSFRSKPLDTHDKAQFTFTKAGEITYFCGLHPFMHGKIIVVP